MTPTVRVLALVGALSFIIFLAATAPARVVADALAGADPALTITGTSGSAWRGRARHVQHGGVSLGALEWRLSPLPLLIGRASVRMEVAGPDGRAAARISRTVLTGRTRVSDVSGSAPLATLARIGGATGPLEALVELDGVSLEMRGDEVREAAGTVRLRDTTALVPVRYALGTYVMELGAADGWLVATITESAGALQLAGAMRVHGSGQWVLDARVRAADEDPNLAAFLMLLGDEDAEGFRTLGLEGTL